VIVSSRKLTRVEIDLLKHLGHFGRFPVTVSRRFRGALVPLWRLGLIDIWYRQDRDAAGARSVQFVSITGDGQYRLQAIIANQPEFPSRRLAGSQGQESAHDQSSKPQ
jgi:hypothetical protein